MRPTGPPSRQAGKYSAPASSKNGFFSRFRNLLCSDRRGGTQLRSLRESRHGSLMKGMRSRFVATGLTSTVTRGKLADMPETPPSHARAPVDVFQKARDHERRELIEFARRE